MKKKNFLFASCLLGVFAFSSCEKNLYDESKQPEKETKMTDLVVPQNFDWSDTQEAKAQITPAETTVSVYLDKECKDESLLFQMDMNIEEAIELPLVIPSYAENVYVKYEGVDGVSIVPVKDGQINIKAPQIKNIKSRAAVRTSTNYIGYAQYPGTVMFEDMYPQLGDYDFNDFVAWYSIKVPYYLKKVGELSLYTNKMYINVQVRAVGGIYKYEPYIRLAEVKANNVSISANENFKIISGPKGEVIISYKCPTPKEGYKYYNTEKDELTPLTGYQQIELTFKEAINYEDVLDIDRRIDMYIAKKDQRQEIHLKGYDPVYGKPQAYADKNNFVWGIKVSASLYHAAEGENFLKAYPKFKEWVTSGGTENKNWWNSINPRYVIMN